MHTIRSTRSGHILGDIADRSTTTACIIIGPLQKSETKKRERNEISYRVLWNTPLDYQTTYY